MDSGCKGKEIGNEKWIAIVDLQQISYKNVDPRGLITAFQFLQVYISYNEADNVKFFSGFMLFLPLTLWFLTLEHLFIEWCFQNNDKILKYRLWKF